MKEDLKEPKRRALGRGLEELFNIEEINYGNYEKLEEKIISTATEEEVREIPLDELRVNPYQPRTVFNEEALKELATSIKEFGVFQPIIVKKSIKGYEIVAGERRFRASKLAGKTTIPAIVRDFTDEQMMEIAILENLQRENLNALEEANAYHNLMIRLNLTQEEVAEKVGKSRSHITNLLGLLTLPETIKKQIEENKISMGHARVLSKLEDKTQIEKLASEIINENLSVRQLEERSQDKEFVRKNKISKYEPSREYIQTERMLSDYFGTRVKIKNNKVEIKFVNHDDLNRILDLIPWNKNE